MGLPLSSASTSKRRPKRRDAGVQVGIDAARASGMVVSLLRDGGAAGSNPRRARSAGLPRRVRAAAEPHPRRGRGVWKIHPGEVAASAAGPTRTASARRSSVPRRGDASTLARVRRVGRFRRVRRRGVVPSRGSRRVRRRRRQSRRSVLGQQRAGKTTLVMAPMWALTGASDTRIEGSSGKTLTKTDVVNDARAARVRLEGTVDDEPFWVEATRQSRGCSRYGTASATRNEPSRTRD